MKIPKTNIEIILKAKSKKGKDRVNEQGSKWVIEAVCEKVLFDDKFGPWLGLRAVKNNDFFRWVHLNDDENFEVILKSEEQEKDFFEDFVKLRWVKWTKRKPKFNGFVLMRFNGKNTGLAHVFRENLITLEGLSKDSFPDYEDTFYWMEEKMELDKYSKYLDMKDKQNTL